MLQLHLLAQPVPFHFHTAHRDIEEGGNFFGGQIKAQVGTQFQVIVGQLGMLLLYFLKKLLIRIFESFTPEIMARRFVEIIRSWESMPTD